MQVKLSRYKKVIVSFLSVLSIAVGVCSFSFNSSAAVVDEYYLDYAEPACSSTQGYVSLALQKNTTGKIDIFTFFWNSVALDDNVEQPCMMYIDIVDNGVIYFSPYVNLAYADSAMYTVTRIGPDGVFVPYYPTTGASTKVSWAFSMHGYTFVGMKYGGNAIGDYAQEQHYDFALYFATDGSSKQLMQLYSLVQDSNNLTVDQTAQILKIVNSNASIDSKLSDLKEYVSDIRDDLDNIQEQLDEIIGKQEEHTSWLQKIWESLQEFVGRNPSEESSTPVDPEDNLGSIEESEDILLPDTSDAESSLDVELNSGFGVLTWLVDSFAKLDPGIFSTYLTMLTFGVIALILGR